MFDWIGDFFQWAAIVYLIRNRPGTLMLLAGAVLAIVLAWKHNQKSTTWKWSPRQAFDLGLGIVTIYLLGVGTWLTFWQGG